MTKYEEEFIKQGGKKLEEAADRKRLEQLRTIYGEEAWKKEMLSASPTRRFGVIVNNPIDIIGKLLF